MRRIAAALFALAFVAGCSLADPDVRQRKAIDDAQRRIVTLDAQLGKIQEGKDALASEPASDDKTARLADLEGQEKTLREQRSKEEEEVKRLEGEMTAAKEAAEKEAAAKEAAEKEAAAKEAAEREAAAKAGMDKEAAAKAAADKEAADKEAAAKAASAKEGADKEAAAKAAAAKEAAEKEAAAKAAAEKEAAAKAAEKPQEPPKPEPPKPEPPKPAEPMPTDTPKPAEPVKLPDTGKGQTFEEKYADVIREVRAALLKR